MSNIVSDLEDALTPAKRRRETQRDGPPGPPGLADVGDRRTRSAGAVMVSYSKVRARQLSRDFLF